MNCKALSILLIVFISRSTALAQSAEDLVAKLGWHSITTDHQYHSFILNYQDTTVRQLIARGKPVSNSLLKAIGDSRKTVAIHIILTKIWEPENANDHLSLLYQYKDCNDLAGWHYLFNGLVWEWSAIKDLTIESSEVRKIKTYWTQAINGNAKPELERNVEIIFASLEEKDRLQFPCGKHYENNSAVFSANTVVDLLNRNARLSALTDLFTALGNDSTQSSYKDCFFVSYDTDGVSFRFNTDSTLTTVFLKEPFRGEIPYGIKFSDNRATIEKRFGAPSTLSKWSGHVTVSYRHKKLYMDFNDKGNMTNFYLSNP